MSGGRSLGIGRRAAPLICAFSPFPTPRQCPCLADHVSVNDSKADVRTLQGVRGRVAHQLERGQSGGHPGGLAEDLRGGESPRAAAHLAIRGQAP